MSRPSAGDRMRRLLAIVPWIVAHQGVTLAEVAARFDLSEAELTRDLQVVWMVGLPPYTPDALVDVIIEDGRVWIDYAPFFTRPLRLTPAQALALVASADALLDLPGTDPDGPLARALAKLSVSLGGLDQPAVDVELGSAETEVLQRLREALDAGHEVTLSYYSYGRDAHSERDVSPWRLFAAEGAWYLQAWCQQAGGERVFRVDRIARVSTLGEHRRHDPPADDADLVTFQASPGDPRVTLDLAPEAAWVTDYYPAEAVERRPDGSLRVTLAVTAAAWLDRLLLRLGPDVRVVAATGLDEAADRQAAAARRVLQRYRPGPR
jgi:proteasome accessory factor C